MIIFFSGNVGCGKTTLAKFIARRFKFFYLDADKFKKQIYSTDVNPEIYFTLGKPVPDKVRAKLYKKIELELKKLSKKFNNIIIDETLHSSLGRRKLINTGEKFFGQSLVIHIQSPLKLIKTRNAKKRTGHLLSNTYQMHLSIKKVAHFFPRPNLTVTNKDLLVSKRKLIQFINKLLCKPKF